VSDPGSLLRHLDINEALTVEVTDGDAVVAASTSEELVAERVLAPAVGDEGIVLPEADPANQTYAALRRSDVASAGIRLAWLWVLGSLPRQERSQFQDRGVDNDLDNEAGRAHCLRRKRQSLSETHFHSMMQQPFFDDRRGRQE